MTSLLLCKYQSCTKCGFILLYSGVCVYMTPSLAHDPYLVYVAFLKGFCGDKLVAVADSSSLFGWWVRDLAKRRRLDLCVQMLASNNIHHCQLIDQVFPLPCLLDRF